MIATDKEKMLEGSIAVYPFKDGYIVHKELEIERLDKNYNELWFFEGGDVFLTKDSKKYPPIQIVGDTIELFDWNYEHYVLDEFGQRIG